MKSKLLLFSALLIAVSSCVINERYIRIYGNLDQYSYLASFRVPETPYYCILVDTTANIYKDLYISKDSLMLHSNRNDSSVTHIKFYKCDDWCTITMSSDSLFFKGKRRDVLVSKGAVDCRCQNPDSHIEYVSIEPYNTPAIFPRPPFCQLLWFGWNNSTYYNRPYDGKSHDLIPVDEKDVSITLYKDVRNR